MKHILTIITPLLIVGVLGGYTQKKANASDYNYKRAMRLLQNKHGYDD